MDDNKKRNLFTYATKELSQDAFLMWLFNNYDDEEVAPVAYAFLRKFCREFEEDEKILSLETKTQWHRVDVSVWFETDKGKKYALFIEDKVDSGEHNQLEEYNKHIKTIEEEGYKVSKVYYKPGYLYPDEIERVQKAGWKHFEFDEICTFLKPFASSPNPIVRMYIDHIFVREKALSITEKPQKNDTQLDQLAWFAFYKNTVIPHLEREFGKTGAVFGAWHVGQYSYICLPVHHKNEEHIPYLEIRSRDCTDGKFKALILCYGMDEAYISKQEALIERIKNSDMFECKNLHYHKKGKQIFPKQIGYTKEGLLQAGNTEEFIEAAKMSVRAFLELMKDWD